MLHFIGALIAGVIGIFAALIGIGIGLGALLLAALPFLLMLFIALLPVLLVIWLLRAIGILSGPFLTFVAIIVLFFFLVGGAHNVFERKSQSVEDWVEAKKEQLETCQEQGGKDVTVQWEDDDLVFTCRGKTKASKPATDTHI